MAKRRLSGVRKTDDEALGSLFVHALPQAWAHGGEAALEALLSRALDEMQVGFTIADNLADDTPVVWLSRGFSRMTGYSFAQGVGRNCRFLQTEATDPAAVDKISAALRKGESVRVHLWNVSKSGRGFWNFLSLHRSRDIEDCVRYFLGFQLIIPRYQLLWLSRQQRGAGVAGVEAPPSVPPPTK